MYIFTVCSASAKQNLTQNSHSRLCVLESVERRHNTLEKDILLGTMPGKRRQGGQKKQWLDDITQWSGQSLVNMVRMSEDRVRFRRFIHDIAYAR